MVADYDNEGFWLMAEIEIDVKGTDELRRKLSMLAPAVAASILEQGAKYLQNFMRQYPPSRYVSRASAYPDAPAGPGWFSDKQRKYVMARIREGSMTIPYGRTNTLQRGWQTKKINQWAAQVYNVVPYSKHVMSDEQSRHEQSVGWRKASDIAAEKFQGMRALMSKAARDAIRRLGLNAN